MGNKKFGTAPVFFTAISTILGAILFLRFGFAVGHLGFWGVILIVLLGHLVTIPTALAISEIATNKRVEGGGEYFIISRSFGLNIGATIGVTLFISQAISVAFYVIAFTEAFEFFFNWITAEFNFTLPRQAISIPAMSLLAYLIIKKGAGMGVKTLYFVVGILFISLVLFFIGSTGFEGADEVKIFKAQINNPKDFFMVFAIIFPAFTGMTAGVGLSGDLKKPSKSIPLGTTLATLFGMVIYIFIIYKLVISASTADLMEHQLIMAKIAIGGAVIIPLGLAASTISSALGSIMVAPRTLQALALDRAFPYTRANRWLSQVRSSDSEPVNASIVTIIIAFVFVVLGDVNAVASIISMFFMVTYGSLCLISFLNHFGASPSYRPSFKSKWILSLLGFVISVWVMFKINTPYAILAFILISFIYIYLSYHNKNNNGFALIFTNAIFQLNRNLQVFLQSKQKDEQRKRDWRPSVICISKYSFNRDKAFQLLRWISFKYGFGTYLHHIEGFYSKSTVLQSEIELEKLIDRVKTDENHVYVDTIISPSSTSAIAQAIQIPGIAGMENNMVIFEFDKESSENISEITDNFSLVAAGNFDICILSSSRRAMNFKQGIHVWIQTTDVENSNLLILLSFIIQGHPDWKKSEIKVFSICEKNEEEDSKQVLSNLIHTGRIPITDKNIEIIRREPTVKTKSLINEKSKNAGLVLVGLRQELLHKQKEKFFEGYEDIGTALFVYSHNQKEIE